jgi:hypothetical protein
MNNLYLVVSEQITPYMGWACALEPPEPYHIACLVVARSYKHALWLAWQDDDSYTGDVTERPKMSCNLRFKDCEIPIGVIKNSHKQKYDKFWYSGRYIGNEGQLEDLEVEKAAI